MKQFVSRYAEEHPHFVQLLAMLLGTSALGVTAILIIVRRLQLVLLLPTRYVDLHGTC